MRKKGMFLYLCLCTLCPEAVPSSKGTMQKNGWGPQTLFHAVPQLTLSYRGGCGNLCAEETISSQL